MLKRVRIRSFSVPYFPAFGLNMERCSVSLFVQSKCRKIRNRKLRIQTLLTQCFFYFHAGNFQLVNRTFRISKHTVFAIAANAISADAAFCLLISKWLDWRVNRVYYPKQVYDMLSYGFNTGGLIKVSIYQSYKYYQAQRRMNVILMVITHFCETRYETGQ